MQLLKRVKTVFYFPLAHYFRFWAQIRLNQWKPRIVVITGSSGKTTLLHLIESQLGDRAHYSHGANSSYGIPFDILGLKRATFLKREWPLLFLKAPFAILKPLPKERIYVVEADCDRPHEGKFLATLLRPEVTLWLSISRTHTVNFDRLVRTGKFQSIESAIAYEFGHFIQRASALVIANGDSALIADELSRTKAQVKTINKTDHFQKYEVKKSGQSEFKIDDRKFLFNYLLPEETAYSILTCLMLLDYLEVKPDYSFSQFRMPPGRSSIFKGIKNTTLVDSTYNAPSYEAVGATLRMFDKLPMKEKWVILGDIIEHKINEREEHKKLGEVISRYEFNRILLMGPRVGKFTYPIIKRQVSRDKRQGVIVEKFLRPTEVLEYLQTNLNGGETILFKGAGFLEGVVEHLLENKEDVEKLCRREKIWQKRRKEWGL